MKHRPIVFKSCLALAWMVWSCLSHADTQPILLVTINNAETPVVLNRRDVEQLPSFLIEAMPERSIKKSRYRCTSVVEILSTAGLKLSEITRRQKLRSHVLLAGSDGYEVSYAWSELDVEYAKEPALLCYERDGGSLSMNEGALRMITRKDKKHARWVRQVIHIRYYA